MLAVERVARRLAPLALLLRLSLAFPGVAPKRFGVALRATRPSKVAERLGQRLEAEESLSLLVALLAHDRRTRGHSERVAAYATMIADELGIVGDERSRLQWGALLHDVGKIEVPARILKKPGKLDPAEWRIMAGHPAFGGRLVDPLRPWLGDALSAIDGHHERWDSSGYPYRRAAADLPVAARITAVADAFETMTAARSYKDPMGVSAARSEVSACAGSQFDPHVARAFLAASVPRLWLVAGPLSWLAQIPVLGLLVRGQIVPAGLSTVAQGAAAATGQAVTAAAVVGSAMIAGGIAHDLVDRADQTTVAPELVSADAASTGPGGEAQPGADPSDREDAGPSSSHGASSGDDTAPDDGAHGHSPANGNGHGRGGGNSGNGHGGPAVAVPPVVDNPPGHGNGVPVIPPVPDDPPGNGGGDSGNGNRDPVIPPTPSEPPGNGNGNGHRPPATPPGHG